MRILIIEDEQRLAQMWAADLQRKGFTCDLAYTGRDGLEKFYINDYDIVLLDINLPDMLGFEVLKTIKESETPDVGVIILSARHEIDDRSGGLNLGADDYIVKPVASQELHARLNAVVRRMKNIHTPQIIIGDLQIDPMRKIVKINDEPVELLKKEYEILYYLACSHPRVISAEEIFEHVYDEYFNPFSSVLRVHISKLKNKLKAANNDQEVIRTIKGIGYSICIEK